MASRDFLHLRGFQVSTDPAGSGIELLIRGFRNQGEIESFVLRLRAIGLINITPPRVVSEAPEPEPPEGSPEGSNPEETEGNA
jgi:hypothetical protein